MRVRSAAVLFALAAAAAPALAQTPLAEPSAPYRAGRIEVTAPWIPPTRAGVPTAAAYLTIANRGEAADRLVAARCVLARQARIQGPAGLAIGPGQTVGLAPGGLRIVLVGPTRAFRAGEKVPVSLTFARSGSLTAEFDVRETAPVSSASSQAPKVSR